MEKIASVVGKPLKSKEQIEEEEEEESSFFFIRILFIRITRLKIVPKKSSR